MKRTESILYSGFKWPTHDGASGYWHVVPPQAKYANGGRFPGGRGGAKSLAWRTKMVLLDLETCLRGVFFDRVLMFYAETSAYFSAFFLSLFGVKVIWVMHFRESVWFDGTHSGLFIRLKRWNMKFVDHFIVQSRDQLPAYNAKFPGKVSFIPHGWWCGDGPVQRANPKPSIAVVGTTFRDFAFLKAVMERFYELFPEVTFDLVGIDATELGAEKGSYNMRLHGRLETEPYRKLLEQSLFIFLPMTFATANNTLLEGMSLGVPVLCSDVGGARDYVSDKNYLVRNVEDVVVFYQRQCEKSAAEHQAEAETLAEHCRKNFGWLQIREEISALAEGLPPSGIRKALSSNWRLTRPELKSPTE